ncbi:hypothetical protein AV944_01010 [Sphingomonas sp. LK11]|nr:hypothetical protein AV944_01010 [Sphingomonas sp. LK11]
MAGLHDDRIMAALNAIIHVIFIPIYYGNAPVIRRIQHFIRRIGGHAHVMEPDGLRRTCHDIALGRDDPGLHDRAADGRLAGRGDTD